jgi:hypothetical protein
MSQNSLPRDPPALLGQNSSFLSGEARFRALSCLFEESLAPVSCLNTRPEETHMTWLGHHVVLGVRCTSAPALQFAAFFCHETAAVRLYFERADAFSIIRLFIK